VNAVGIDRPGIISDISKIVTDANGNVGESRALKLGEHFAVMMLIDLQDEGNDEGTVQKMFMTLEDMNVSTFKTKDPAACVSGTKIGCKLLVFLAFPESLHFHAWQAGSIASLYSHHS
jgi:glycine cleavage system regulatory protein